MIKVMYGRRGTHQETQSHHTPKKNPEKKLPPTDAGDKNSTNR